MTALADATVTRVAAEADLAEAVRVFKRDYKDPNSPNNTATEATAHSTHATNLATMVAAEKAVATARAAERALE